MISFMAGIINYIFDTYIFLLLLRFILQKLHVNWHNPVTQFVVALTERIVKPVRRVLPGVKGFDLAILGLAFLFELIELYLLTLMSHGFFPTIGGALLLSAVTLLSKTIYIFFFAVIIWAFLSWFVTAQRHPVTEITGALSDPLIRGVRRFMPLIEGIDLSPLVITFLLYLILHFVMAPLLQISISWALG